MRPFCPKKRASKPDLCKSDSSNWHAKKADWNTFDGGGRLQSILRNHCGGVDSKRSGRQVSPREHQRLIGGILIVEDPSRCIYVRPGGKGLLVGFFETKGASWEPHNIPSSFAFGELDPDSDRMAPDLESALERLTPEV